jgi:isoleucyl-tRNA synthetase
MIWVDVEKPNSTDLADMICIGSLAELEELIGSITGTDTGTDTGQRITNLHPEFVNDIIIKKNGKIYKRIPDTFDCWFESGAVPMSQLHYPFAPESHVLDTREFLSDFICEGMDQTRGWFYTLMVLSCVIFNKPPYRTVMCTGMIKDKDGRKFSKKLGNFVDPMISISKYGADTLRTYFVKSPASSAGDLMFNEEFVEILKSRFTPYINGVKFWIQHTMSYMKQKECDSLVIDQIDSSKNYSQYRNLFDRWILLKTDELVKIVTLHMNEYQFGLAAEQLLDFIEHLTNWYIKFNRDRLKGFVIDIDWIESIQVLYNVILIYCRLWAPITPFISEHIFQHIKCLSEKYHDTNSILLTDYPKISESSDPLTLSMFTDIQRICVMVRTMRDSTHHHNKQVVSLKSCTIYHNDPEYLDILRINMPLVQTELNCINILYESLADNVTTRIEPDKKMIGKMFRNEAAEVTRLIFEAGGLPFRYKSDAYDQMIDQTYYKITKIPKTTIFKDNYMCIVDKELMVCIDYTYDTEIHQMYQIKRMHSLVQEARKALRLQPWNHITVMIEAISLFEGPKNDLNGMLTNADVILVNFKEDPVYSILEGKKETDADIIYGVNFTFVQFPDHEFKSKLIIHFKKE